MALKRGFTLTAALAAFTAGVLSPAQAAEAASNWTRTNGTAQASGTIQVRSFAGGRFYDVAGTITVSQNDGHCYYLRVVRWGRDLDPGLGTNSARQCGAGALPFTVTVFQPYPLGGISYGLCTAVPGAPEEPPYAGLGGNCSQA
jgi:hypothetical protein